MLEVAKTAKSCSKVAEHNRDRPSGDQSTVFCIVSFDLTDAGLQRSGTLLHWFVVVVLPILED